MRFTHTLFALFGSCVFLLLSLLSVHAAPASIYPREVFNPTIITPNHTTTWTAGSSASVTWETSNLPSSANSTTGKVKLGFERSNGKGGLNLDWVLAKDFTLSDGSVTFTVPKTLKARKDYVVVLMGDSGNVSKKFTIHAAS